jgi:two-component system sensor histidine kinase KdpD
MIDQVLTNLLENAAKHTPPGTPVRVMLERDGEALRLCVADRGPGVPPEAAGQIFDKFQRVRRPGGPPRGPGEAPPAGAGAGLGLAVSRGFVEAHAGRLELVPTTGGATFCFSLPLEVSGLSSPVSRPSGQTEGPDVRDRETGSADQRPET